MVDRERLRQSYARALKVCAGLALTPVLLVAYAWYGLHSADARFADAGSGTIPATFVIVLGAAALSPVVAVPVLRLIWRRDPDFPFGGSDHPESLILMHGIIEFTVWEISSLLGFVMFTVGATWTVFLAAVCVSYAGYAFSVPRWSRWQRLADAFDARASTAAVAVGP